MDKYIKQYAQNYIDKLGLIYAQNHFAILQQKEKEKPDQTLINAAEFNMTEAEKQIAWYKKFTKPAKK